MHLALLYVLPIWYGLGLELTLQPRPISKNQECIGDTICINLNPANPISADPVSPAPISIHNDDLLKVLEAGGFQVPQQ